MREAVEALAAVRLPVSLGEFVAVQRKGGATWKDVAEELRSRVGVSVSHETLRTWYGVSDPAERVS